MLEIERTLVVSTGHLTQQEMEHVAAQDWGHDTEYFTTVSLAFIAEAEGVPENLQRLLELARQNDCQHLKFDRDGPLVEGLPSFDW